MTRVHIALSGLLLGAVGCGSGNKECSPTSSACCAPTQLKGKITNAQSGAAVANARVVAIDGDSQASVGPVAISDAAGNYAVRVEAPRMSGAHKQFTLRVSAASYQDFPSGIRI